MKKNLLGISLLTITGLYCLLSLVIITATLLLGLPVINGIVISIIVLILQFIISPFMTDLSMKWFYKAKFDSEIPEYLKKFIQEVCTNNNMKYPKIGYIDDGAPNAFTYGHTKNNARIILTRGIFELLTEEEVKAVVGHELGHAVHYDMLFMTVAQLVPLLLYAIYDALISNNNDDDNGNTQLVAMIAYILYVISNYIVLWLSRTREYYADNFSLETTKNPNALANALVKIGYGLTTNSTNTKHSASKSNALGIFDSKTSKSLIVTSTDNNQTMSKENIKQAMKWEKWNYWAIIYELNSTHPLISKRLLAISERSADFGQEPYIVFDLEKKESYMDDFLIEVLINFLPSFLLIMGLIILLINESKIPSLVLILLSAIFSMIKFKTKYKSNNFQETKVKDLLGEVKVSHITSIPCSLTGTIIGRGNPGCIFNEDFVIKDETGIMFLDYNQPLVVLNKIFALFSSPNYFDKNITIEGWYRRSPVPYVELRTINIDGKVKKIHTYTFKFLFHIIVIIIPILLFVMI